MASRCTEVSPLCPVEYTTLGYYPNRPLNIFCAVAFGLALIIQLVIGVWKKTYAFTGFVVAGCALEVAGSYLSFIPDEGVTTVMDRSLPTSMSKSWVLRGGRRRVHEWCSFAKPAFSLGRRVREMVPS
jgi:hypothetical protein